MWDSREIEAVRECGVCRQELLIWREVRKGKEDRVVACDRKSGDEHVCFDLPQDANLLVMEDIE
jgi:hypothetical protein